MAEATQTPEGQTRLIRHFDVQDIKDYTDGWSQLWDSDDSDLWDRSKPSPALIDLVEERRDLFHPVTGDGRRKRALVPGCGKGYDVVMLALHGFDVYGLDVSATGVSTAQDYARGELANPQSYNFGSESSATEAKTKKGEVTILQGDFFKSDWDRGMRFDLIYDYTFLCALHPTMRLAWASRMADLLAPTGQLVCLEFPLWKDPKLPGPPWGLKGVHWNLLAQGGDGVVDGEEVEQSNEGGKFTRTLYVKPGRSYEQSRGTDMLSVYVKK
ncbi:thiol methyltransferase [Aspergillus steynii IBT 23096]|uniref:Thiol methyltransferase n=1 Tax=Aspergillus steynii IBT 23096 TaxID=1392250 RepID=A0A2I2G6M4_9EURO|nr:thiol methyltransferase [Aspergillus steynii IBT 23096]PLB48524.1 thiol methyltransferase [Aspergillus steynii IBT 23096]